MKTTFKIINICYVIGIIAAVMAACAGITMCSLASQRVTQPFVAETSRLTESNSRNRIDGVNLGLASLCLNMRTEANDQSKRAFASMIIAEADSFQRQELLTPSNQACIAEARGLFE